MFARRIASRPRLVANAAVSRGRRILLVQQQQEQQQRFDFAVAGVDATGNVGNTELWQAGLQRRCFSTSWDNDDSHQMQYATGTVLTYDRKGAYGFIGVDGRPRTGSGVFVHRSGIQSLQSSDDSPFYPFLSMKERVRFQIETDEQGRERAVNVVFEDGRLIPPLRGNYLVTRMEKHKELLGNHVLQIIKEKQAASADENNDSDDETASPEVTLEKIQQAVNAYDQELERAHEKIRSMGMDPEQFSQP